jgi:excisionase family DNA binding protein
MKDKLLTTKEAAARLGMSHSNVCRLIRKEILPAVRIGERVLVVRERDLARAEDRPRAGRRWPVKKE